MSGKDWRIAALATLVLAATGAACDKVPLLAPTSSTITINAPTRVLQLGGSTEVTAFVFEASGTPVQNGTTVHFSTTLGSFTSAEAQTRNGAATTTFNAGMTSGTAEVRATSGTAGAGTTTGTGTAASGTNVISIQIGAAAATTVGVSASPQRVPSTGGTATVAASVTDASGNPIRGVNVTFSTDAGTLSASSAATDDTGVARVELTTSRTATVSARVGNLTAVTTSVTVATPSTVGLTVSPNPATPGVPVTLTVTPTVATGGTAPRVTVNWGDGSSSEDLGIVTAARTVTHTYSSQGVYTIVATATSDGETTTGTVVLTVNVRPAPTLTAAQVGATKTFNFTVTPASGGVPMRNIVIDFGEGDPVDLGAISGPTTVSKTYSGSGSKTVRATQTDTNGGTSSAATVITVP